MHHASAQEQTRLGTTDNKEASCLQNASNDTLVKREVENKTRTKQIDGGGTNGSFLIQIFLKKKVFTGKIHNLN
jgi:hypothetical protein